MNFNEYQERILDTVCYDDKVLGPYYSVLGLCGEAGEVADKLKKIYRDKDWKNISDEDKKAIAKELGDVLWYVAKMCHDLGLCMDCVAQGNLSKCASRKSTNTLHGEGDDREQLQECYNAKKQKVEYCVGDIIQVVGNFTGKGELCKIIKIDVKPDVVYFELANEHREPWLIWGEENMQMVFKSPKVSRKAKFAIADELLQQRPLEPVKEIVSKVKKASK